MFEIFDIFFVFFFNTFNTLISEQIWDYKSAACEK